MAFHCRKVYQTREKSGNNTRDRVVRLVGFVTLRTTNLQCTNLLDRVFALLGFIHQDYTKKMQIEDGITVRDLYTQFIHFILHREKGSWHHWDKLLHMAIAQHGTHQLTSWCLDLHRVKENHLLIWILGADDPEGFKPSLRQRLSRQGNSADELIFRGCLVDTIDELGQVLAPLDVSSYQAYFEWVLSFCQWEHHADGACHQDL
jgi:hypothetical protein